MTEARRKYDAQFREEAVRAVRETGRPIAQVASDLGVSPRTLANWVGHDRAERERIGSLTPSDKISEPRRRWSIRRIGDRLADPDRRISRWFTFAAVVIATFGSAIGLLQHFGNGDQLPSVSGQVGPPPTGEVSKLPEVLEEDEIVELHLWAIGGDVEADRCGDEHLLNVCGISWDTACEPLTRDLDIPRDDPTIPCTFNLQTVDERGNLVRGWDWNAGHYLNGYYAVEYSNFRMDVLTVSVREIPPEQARELTN